MDSKMADDVVDPSMGRKPNDPPPGRKPEQPPTDWMLPEARRRRRPNGRAGMPFTIFPHMLRHACGYALANAGHDTRALQAWLGHKNIQHTVRYTLVSAFLRGLGETGFVEGRNVAIEFRWAHNNNERLPEFAADLVRRRVAVIVAPQSTAAVMEAKAATRTIPIVFGTRSDPVQAGLVRLRRARVGRCWLRGLMRRGYGEQLRESVVTLATLATFNHQSRPHTVVT
jgi:Phage integrase family/ABC transporter substrate binding protein